MKNLTSNDIYVSKAKAAYVTGCNMLGIEYLVINKDLGKYITYRKKMDDLTYEELVWLHSLLSYDGNIEQVDWMLYRGDYTFWLDNLLRYLDAKSVKCPKCGNYVKADYFGSANGSHYYRCSRCTTKFITHDDE